MVVHSGRVSAAPGAWIGPTRSDAGGSQPYTGRPSNRGCSGSTR